MLQKFHHPRAKIFCASKNISCVTQFYKFSWRTNFFSFKRANVCAKFPLSVSLSFIVYRLVARLSFSQLISPLYHFSVAAFTDEKGRKNCGGFSHRQTRGCVGLIQGQSEAFSKTIPGRADRWMTTTRHLPIEGEFPRARPSTCNDLCNVEGWKYHEVEKFPETFLSAVSFSARLTLSYTIRRSFFSPASVQLKISTGADVFFKLFVCRRARFFLCYYWLCWEKLKQGKIVKVSPRIPALFLKISRKFVRKVLESNVVGVRGEKSSQITCVFVHPQRWRSRWPCPCPLLKKKKIEIGKAVEIKNKKSFGKTFKKYSKIAKWKLKHANVTWLIFSGSGSYSVVVFFCSINDSSAWVHAITRWQSDHH